ncbi:MAG: VWA domain-containing protein [Candidatus Aminicenantes bacterium]|nr:VWA domain-containing protein [Candidatus Aminicenantes bacterium]
MSLRKFGVLGFSLLFVGLGFPKSYFYAGHRQEQKPVEYEVAVTVKLIQVYVTDKKGKPVRDLTKEDFIVTDSGRPVKLSEFEKHLLEVAAEKIAPPPPKEKEQVVTTPIPPPEALSRKFFLFFDFAFNNQRGVRKSKEAALHFIDTEVKPDDEVGLISYSMLNGLAIHEFLTTDHRKVREAVKALSVGRIAGRAGDIEEEYWRQATEGQPRSPFYVSEEIAPLLAKKSPIFNWRRQESKNLSENFILKLTALARSLRYIPGQKHLILFSTGIANSLIYGNQAGNPQDEGLKTDATGAVLSSSDPTVARAKFDTGDYILRTLNEDMLKEITAANCTVFAFDTREAALVPSLFTYDEQTFEENRRDLFYDQGIHQTATDQMKDNKITGQYSLRRLSVTSGGKYYSNIEKYKENLDQVQDMTGSYYVLGYYITEQWDGRYHPIKVEVKRKGCEVRAQMGYFNPKPYAEYSDLEKQLQLFDLTLSEKPIFQTPLALPINTLSYAAGEETRLQVLSRIPRQVMEKFSGKRAEFIALLFDAKENLVDLQRREADLANFRSGDVLYASGTALAPGSYRCRLVLRDMETGTSALGSTRVNVARKAFVGLSLHSPLLLIPDGNVAYLEAATGKKKVMTEWNEFYGYNRAQYSPIAGEVPKGTAKLFVAVPCSIVGLVQPEIVMTAYLVNSASGERIPLAGSILDRAQKEGGEAQFLELLLNNLPPGKYTLYLHAEAAGTKYVSYAKTNLTIK